MWLEQGDEFFDGKAGLLEDAVEGSALQISAMEWNDHEARLGWMAEETMRAGRVV